MLAQLDNVFEIPVLDHTGKLVEKRELVNTPVAELLDPALFKVIDWLRSTKIRPTSQQLQEGVEHAGNRWLPYYHGSGVKTGSTYGTTSDFLTLPSCVEDLYRVGRWLFAQGLYGGVVGQLRVKLCKDGDMTPYGPIGDGCGYIRKSVTDLGYNGLKKVNLGKTKQTYTFWQRVILFSKEVQDELLPYVGGTLTDLLDPAKVLLDYSHESLKYKEELYLLDKDMVKHCYVAKALDRAWGELFSRVSTTVMLPVYCKICIPANVEHTTLRGKHILYRVPLDSPSMIQALDDDPEQPEIDRVAEAETIQYSMSTLGLSIKGITVPSVFNEDDPYDLYICCKDIKMSSYPNLRKQRQFVFDGVMSFNMWYGKGSAIGINTGWAGTTEGADVDGDMFNFMDAENLPVLFELVKTFPVIETPKIPKTHTEDMSRRWEFLHNSMIDFIGWATNSASKTFVYENRDFLAQQLGYRDAYALDCTIQGFMKIGQDMYKTFIDMDKKVQLLTIFDKKLEKLGLKAPWTDWPNDYAFKHMIPSVIKREELEQEWVVKMSDKDANEAVWPAMAGTVPTICRWTLPSLKDVHEVQIDILPQGFFRRWVLKPSDELYQEARAFQDWYNARSERVNWTDPASVKKLRKDMLEPIETWLAKRSVVEASDALWWVAHSMSDDLSASASVFIAFPEECKRIVGTKPGKGAKHLYIVSGLHNQLPENPDELEFDGEIMTVSWPDKKLKVNVARKIIVASVPGQVPPSNTTLPNRTLAFFVVDRAQPDDGRYHIKLTRFSKASHSALLS